METRMSQLERAFELAASGRCVSVADIKRKLREEGYMDDQVEGPLLFGQLNTLMKKTNRQSGPTPGQPASKSAAKSGSESGSESGSGSIPA